MFTWVLTLYLSLVRKVFEQYLLQFGLQFSRKARKDEKGTQSIVASCSRCFHKPLRSFATFLTFLVYFFWLLDAQIQVLLQHDSYSDQ